MKPNKEEVNHGAAQMLEDLAQLAGALFGVAMSNRGQWRDQAKKKLELTLMRLPFVTRDDHDALHAMLQKARLEQESLTARLDALEGKTIHTKKSSGAADKKPVNKKLTGRPSKSKKSSPSRNKV